MRSLGLSAGLASLIFGHVVYTIPIAGLIFGNDYAPIPTEISEAVVTKIQER